MFNKLGFSIDLTKDHVYPPSKVFNLNTNAVDIGTGKLIGIAPFAKAPRKDCYPLDLMQKLSLIFKITIQFLFGYGKIEMQTINRWSSALKNVYSCEDLGGFENEVALISNLNLMVQWILPTDILRRYIMSP